MDSLNKKSSISVKEILHSSWESYVNTHDVADYQIKEVDKALDCYGHNNGCFVFYCKQCDKYIFQSYGCNSRICSCCGKRYTDQWSLSLSNCMFPVSHRHFVMSVPDALWPFLKDWNLRKVYMDAAIHAFNEFFSKITHRNIKVGVIVILHPYGKDMKDQPHLHLLITEGGFDSKGKFINCSFIPADGFRKKWQYEVMRLFQLHGLSNSLATQMYERYPKGFYVWLHKRGRIKHPRLIAKYVGRYVRHPAIANSRIYYFDGEIVKFFYVNNEDIRINVTMNVEQFITALIQHIPPPQFKMIRYYGAYARRTKGKLGAKVQSSIKQLNLYHFGLERIKYCPFCKNELEFVWYCKKPPPEESKIQRELMQYIS
ncbi:MAG: transposase [Nitrosopumilus sp.]